MKSEKTKVQKTIEVKQKEIYEEEKIETISYRVDVDPMQILEVDMGLELLRKGLSIGVFDGKYLPVRHFFMLTDER